MTDERFVFQEDVKERGKMKTGAMHKKGAKRVTNCKFPSDYLTKKEKEKLSGPVISIKMDQPYYGWKEFKKLPDGLKREYLEGLVNNYGARGSDLAGMFGVNAWSVYDLCKSLDVKLPRGGQKTIKMDERWLDFITKPGFDIPAPKKTDNQIIKEQFGIDFDAMEKPKPEVVEEAKKEELKPRIVEEKKVVEKFEGVDRLNLAMNGSKQVILSMLESVLGTDCDYAIKFDIVKVVKGPMVYASGVQEDF